MAASTKPLGANLNEQLSLVISSEITVKAMIVLSDGPASPKYIAERLDISTPKASHHVKKLERLGLAELIEERDVGGSIQHIYRAVIRPIVSDDDWEKLSIDERQRYSIWIVQLILADAVTSFDAELFDREAYRHLSRAPLAVDDEGFREVAEIQNRALGEVIDVVSKSTSRRTKTGEPAVDIISAMMCFQLPAPSEGPALRPKPDDPR